MYDIVGIYNGNGDLRAKYTYDSWGNVTSIIDGNGNAITSATHVGNLNPFRYRGYYMDTETGMYYLMSRYYDPVTHRFLNADGYFQTGLGILDSNMNAYCGNNPINFLDPTGAISAKAMQNDILFNPDTSYTIKDAIMQEKAELCYSLTFANYSNDSFFGPITISYYSKLSYSSNCASSVELNITEFSATKHKKFGSYDLSYNIDQKCMYGLLGKTYDKYTSSVGFGRQHLNKAEFSCWDVTVDYGDGWYYSQGYMISISNEAKTAITATVAIAGLVVLGVVLAPETGGASLMLPVFA